MANFEFFSWLFKKKIGVDEKMKKRERKKGYVYS